MKKPVKKPAKKAIAKPKLIEGKYSHKFLTRLEPDTGKALERLMTISNNKTFNGTVKFVIDSYIYKTQVLENAKKDLEIIENRHEMLYKACKNFIVAQKEMINLLDEYADET